MAKPGPKPFTGKFSAKIAALKPSKQVYFKGAKPGSLKAIASRAGLALGREFSTRSESGGVLVTRET